MPHHISNVAEGHVPGEGAWELHLEGEERHLGMGLMKLRKEAKGKQLSLIIARYRPAVPHPRTSREIQALLKSTPGDHRLLRELLGQRTPQA